MKKNKKIIKFNFLMNQKIITENRKARYNYNILDTIEAGIVLLGSEVKSLRHNGANITESYASIEDNEIFLSNTTIEKYIQANRENHELKRLRKLLLQRKQINKLKIKIQKTGMTIIPLKLFFNKQGKVKILLGIAKGKTYVDKRQDAKKKDWERDKLRLIQKNNNNSTK